MLAANARSYEQRLAATKMVLSAETATPTVLGVLVLSNRRGLRAGAYVQFLRIAGRELADPIVDEQLIDGPVAEVLRRTDEKLAAHNRIAVDLTSGSLEKRTFSYPMSALQQIVRNAVMHRSYEATHAPVRVTWYDDRIEISNPGGPFGTVTIENFGPTGGQRLPQPQLGRSPPRARLRAAVWGRHRHRPARDGQQRQSAARIRGQFVVRRRHPSAGFMKTVAFCNAKGVSARPP